MKLAPSVRPATVDDAVFIARNLRDEDLREAVAATMRDPSWSLIIGVERGAAFVWEVDGKPAVLFGATPINAISAAVWMVGTPALYEYQRFLLRHVRPWIETLNARWPLLVNTADARNELHLKFIKWSGFTFFNMRTVNGLRFIDFARINRHL